MCILRLRSGPPALVKYPGGRLVRENYEMHTGKIARKAINHYGDGVMKVFGVLAMCVLTG